MYDILQPLILTAGIAAATTLILVPVATLIAAVLAFYHFRGRAALEAVVALPLVLPPTVVGFYLLLIMGVQSPLGRMYESVTGSTLVFSATGLIVASVFYSLPFAVQPLVTAFRSMDQRLLAAAATLGATPLVIFTTVVLPLCKRALLASTILSFAHTVGEFGVVLMVGGSIPGRTRVASIAIYDFVEGMQYGNAHLLSGILLAFSFAVLWITYRMQGRGNRLLRFPVHQKRGK